MSNVLYNILIVILLSPLLVVAQSDTVITYSKVNTIDSVSKSEIFSRAQTWFNITFKSSKDVLQISDKDAGHLAGKGWGVMNFQQKAGLGINQTISTKLNFNIDVWVKEGKYKYIITNIDATDQSSAKYHYGILTSAKEMPVKMYLVGTKRSNDFWAKLKSEAQIYVGNLSKSLEDHMMKPTAGSDNW